MFKPNLLNSLKILKKDFKVMTDIKKIIVKIQELQDLHGVDLEDPAARKAAADVFLQKQREVQKGINSIRDV